jgi:hexaprenyl-diphosphate synthase
MITKIGFRSPRLARTVTPLRLIRHSSVAVQDVRTIPSRDKEPSLAEVHRIPVQNTFPPALADSPARTIDPFKYLAGDLDDLREDLLSLVPSTQPELTSIARYYFESSGKHLRPVLILLFAQAANGLASGWDAKCGAMVNADPDTINRPLSPADVLTDFNPALPGLTEFPNSNLFSPYAWQRSSSRQASFHTFHSPLPSNTSVLPTQRRLAQITEMIHVASLLHDDVIDKADSRRSRPSAPAKFGNKLSILGGDFLLARASAALARLGDLEVVELVSSMINNLVEGEVAQIEEVFGGGTMMGASLSDIGPDTARWNFYLKKCYLKTASLMAKSARASVVLGGAQSGNTESTSGLSDEQLKDIAYLYGRNIGIAFQVSRCKPPWRYPTDLTS